MNVESGRFDSDIYDLIPHRPPMLLINRVVDLNASGAKASVLIDTQTPFFQAGLGVPSWIGLEYMGQTAALIAGFQIRKGLIPPHLGFLLGCRQYKVEQDYFLESSELLVSCSESAMVGEELAMFDCSIQMNDSATPIATARLSVFRKPQSDTLKT